MKFVLPAIAPAIAFVVAIATTPAAGAAELLMMTQPACPWCARFDAEIAPAWPNTEEGKRAPLRRVDITQPWPDDLKDVLKERFTPTFVLMDEGKEIARLRGYPGDEFFWYRIGEMLDMLPPDGDG